MSDSKWYYHDGAPQGPLSRAELQKMFNEGTLTKEALLHREGYEGWFPAYDFDVFFPGFQRRRRKKYLFNPKEAHHGHRIAAFLVDMLVLVSLVIGASYGFGILYDGLVTGPTPDWAIYATGAFGLLMGWVYFAVMESSRLQATLGKLMFGLRVTGYSGSRISFTQAAARSFGKLLSTLAFGYGCILAMFTRDRQSLHDMLSDSRVVRK